MVFDLIPCWSGLSSTINIFGKHFWPNSEGLYLLSQGTNFLPCLITPDYIFFYPSPPLCRPFSILLLPFPPFPSLCCPSPPFITLPCLHFPITLTPSPLFPSFPGWLFSIELSFLHLVKNGKIIKFLSTKNMVEKEKD